MSLHMATPVCSSCLSLRLSFILVVHSSVRESVLMAFRRILILDTELKICVKVVVAVLGSPSLIVLNMVSVDVKRHRTELFLNFKLPSAA